ncbi:asparagine synthase (glutamine-hydrolyzing) [Gemmiger sp.]|uniref:asparagine synthase (glutamine-hydrolyzing) n=1 Tax=Subdoligranulum variabile TaxID=214851 RepID=A0A943HIN2_9FIRM|nr:asparagine synthase (glutamine-hydrolyzing) [uncultured Gemmiger sp.]MBS5331402.1 asparagine synthase (glutamine-hydrolyzing) [Subdoligranulum variabile]
MCGIAGFISPARADAAALVPMLARIAHRGPDGQGTFVEGPAALGHCRLAIIDLQGGAQPLYSEDKNFVVVFNGEIYNYRELTAELTALGHTFTTRTDTEVLLHGWEQWGRELLPRLRGMFAFALWDRRAQVLFCARDMFGIKPLYYCRCADGTLLFASEIKAFLDHPSFEKQLNTAQLPLYLSCQYSPGRDTFFAGVQKLLPGHFLEFSEGIVRTTRWVQPAFLPGDTPPAPDELEAVLRQSAEAHKIADVEVAGFLSGGVDSAYLTALARPARTYTISYAEPKYDESFPARALARNLGLRNRVRCISPGEFWDAVPAVQYHMDEPMADAAAVALYFLNREAARDVKVVLSGEGADELFGGYNIYRDPFTARWYNRLPPWLRGGLGAAASLLPPGPGVNFLVRRGLSLEERYFGPTALLTEREKRRLLPGYEGDGDPVCLTESSWDMTEDQDPVTRMQQVDLQLWLAGDILLKADKMSMAHSLELRVPYLDKEVFALAAALPAAAKANARMTKIALRQAAARTLPPAAAARKKLGFPVPVRDWLRQEPYTSRVRAVFSRPAAGEFFNVRLLHTMLNHHLHGGDCWRQIWCVYSFLIWYEQFFGA